MRSRCQTSESKGLTSASAWTRRGSRASACSHAGFHPGTVTGTSSPSATTRGCPGRASPRLIRGRGGGGLALGREVAGGGELGGHAVRAGGDADQLDVAVGVGLRSRPLGPGLAQLGRGGGGQGGIPSLE